MKKSIKFTLIGFALLAGVATISSCTASFCSVKDSAKILYTFDRGVTKYHSQADIDALSEQELRDLNVDRITDEVEAIFAKTKGVEEYDLGYEVYASYNIAYSPVLHKEVIPPLSKNGYYIPHIDFFKEIDRWVLTTTINLHADSITSIGSISKETTAKDGTKYYTTNYDTTTLYGALNTEGYRKFYLPKIADDKPENKIFASYDEFIKEIRETNPGLVPGNDFFNFYKQVLTQKMSLYRSCISTIGEEQDNLFGMYGDKDLNGGYYDQIQIETKSWGYAWSKGLLEGLLIYPMSLLTDALVYGFSGGNAGLTSGNGWAQVGAIILVTIIIRSLIMLTSLKSTLGQARMQKLQPQLAKLQEKYPNSNTNQYEKQRLAQEQMALYKKHKISPFSQIIILLVQFPVFICVWGALSGSAALSTGSFYQMNLSDTVWNTLTKNVGSSAWIAAFVLIILMSLFQIAATIIPMFIQKLQRKNVEKLGKNNAVAKQNRTMKIVQIVMLIMIVFMGFTLPSAMGVYWIAGAIFSIAQTLIIYFVNNRSSGPKVKKEKVRETSQNGKTVIEAVAVEEVPTQETTENAAKPQQKNKNRHGSHNFYKKHKKGKGGR